MLVMLLPVTLMLVMIHVQLILRCPVTTQMIHQRLVMIISEMIVTRL